MRGTDKDKLIADRSPIAMRGTKWASFDDLVEGEAFLGRDGWPRRRAARWFESLPPRLRLSEVDGVWVSVSARLPHGQRIADFIAHGLAFDSGFIYLAPAAITLWSWSEWERSQFGRIADLLTMFYRTRWELRDKPASRFWRTFTRRARGKFAGIGMGCSRTAIRRHTDRIDLNQPHLIEAPGRRGRKGGAR